MTEKKRKEEFRLMLMFNDIFMRELGLDINDRDHVYDIAKGSLITINNKFLKYRDYEYPVLESNEIDFNLLENPKLCETIANAWLHDHISNTIVSIDQCVIPGSSKGELVISYIKEDRIENLRSEPFVNESVRVLNLICKILKREHLYDFSKYDIVIDKK